MIVYNSPNHVKERQNAIPLTPKDEKTVTDILNIYHEFWNMDGEFENNIKELLQRFVWNYENMKHHIASCQNNIINNFEVKL